VSIAAAAAELVDALQGAGIRVAVRAGDLTPPVVFVQIGSSTDAGGPLEGATVATFYVYYIPVRGVDNLAGDAEALDTIYTALHPLTWADLVGVRSSVTVANDTWPCYRLDAAVMSAAALKTKVS
jgi:hypothetical protein